MNFFWMDEKGTNPICLVIWTGRRFEIGDLPKLKLTQKSKKARRDHKSCDKKTETRFKITSFLTENIWFTGIVQFHAFYQSCLYPWTDYPMEPWFEIVSRAPRTSGFGNTLTKWFKSNGGFNLSLNMFSKD